MDNSSKKIAVIGAGIGGLAVAARLASRGYEVDVYEKLPRVGGRVHIIEDKGFRFDTGPSFILMRDFFDEIFHYCGKDINDYLDLRVLEQSYRMFFSDGDELNFYRDIEETKKEIERVEKGGAQAFQGFLNETKELYEHLTPYLYQNFTLSSLLNPSCWPLVTKINPFQNYWQLAKKYFRSEKLCYALTFQSMFLGVSPYQAPSFYSMITYADHAQKIYHPMGGMYGVAGALEKLAREFGARFHFEAEVDGISQEKKQMALSFDHTQVFADRVIVNADYVYAQTELLKRRPRTRHKLACSAYLIYLGLKEKIQGMQHHNLFFSRDLKKNLTQIFSQDVVPEDPSFYTHIPTHVDPSLAPPGKDVLYILVPVANLAHQIEDNTLYEKYLKDKVFSRISALAGRPLEDLIECEYQFYPSDFIKRYNLPLGSAFGLAHTLDQSAFLRPSNKDPRFKNLYYVGASTQPGGGLPPVLAGSRIVADLITGDKK